MVPARPTFQGEKGLPERDGVYLLPDQERHRLTLTEAADEVRRSGGQAQLLHGAACDEALESLFDRSADYAAWLEQVIEARRLLGQGDAAGAQRSARRLRKAFDGMLAIDFFPGEAQAQAQEAIDGLEAAIARLTPGEPRAVVAAVTRRDPARYQRRVWATRQRPWVDRLACAWLIRRFIDPSARFVWIASPADLPKRAVGFDFDGAEFSHVGARVTFETLLAAFDLETAALLRLGAIVHALDAGGAQPPEAAGVERVLAGMREAIADDDALMLAAGGVFEGLHVALGQEAAR